jgi:hypothetical protein
MGTRRRGAKAWRELASRNWGHVAGVNFDIQQYLQSHKDDALAAEQS